ncbi:hypothetical protein Y032_1178g3734 [Ancylostoma ceylanicum]|nr:hypothetical protein Y032_1178g3734 [Ancylostoma ceylanicum]
MFVGSSSDCIRINNYPHQCEKPGVENSRAKPGIPSSILKIVAYHKWIIYEFIKNDKTLGAKALKKAVHLFEEKYRNDTAVQAVWDQYQDGISNKMIEANASVQLKAQDGWAVSDMYYVPSSLLEFHAGLMEIFFEARLFHEIAVSKFLYTVPHRL